MLVSCVLVIALVAAGVLVITSRHPDPLSASEATEALRNVAVSGIGPVDEVEGPIRYMSHTSLIEGVTSVAFIELSLFLSKANAQEFYNLHLERNRKGCDGEAIDAAVTGLDFRKDGRVSGAQYVTFTADLADPDPHETHTFTRIACSNLVLGIYFTSAGEPVSAEAIHETVTSIIDAVR